MEVLLDDTAEMRKIVKKSLERPADERDGYRKLLARML